MNPERIHRAAVSLHFGCDIPLVEAEALLRGTGIAPLEEYDS